MTVKGYFINLTDPKAGHDYQGRDPFAPGAKMVPAKGSNLRHGPYPSEREAIRAIYSWPPDRQYKPTGEIVKDDAVFTKINLRDRDDE